MSRRNISKITTFKNTSIRMISTYCRLCLFYCNLHNNKNLFDRVNPKWAKKRVILRRIKPEPKPRDPRQCISGPWAMFWSGIDATAGNTPNTSSSSPRWVELYPQFQWDWVTDPDPPSSTYRWSSLALPSFSSSVISAPEHTNRKNPNTLRYNLDFTRTAYWSCLVIMFSSTI